MSLSYKVEIVAGNEWSKEDIQHPLPERKDYRPSFAHKLCESKVGVIALAGILLMRVSGGA